MPHRGGRLGIRPEGSWRPGEAPRPNCSATLWPRPQSVSAAASSSFVSSFLSLWTKYCVQFSLLSLSSSSSLFTDTHIYVWMELERGGAEGPLMTVTFIYSPLKVLHHRELQCRPLGDWRLRFSCFTVISKRASERVSESAHVRVHAPTQTRKHEPYSLGEQIRGKHV